MGYRVRYVRNITDVGHLEDDRDYGEDKISKRARLEKLEPMEVAQKYTNAYHHKMMRLNVLPPSIEPTASGHILEQQDLVKKILDKGYAYEKEGSVYFDMEKYSRDHNYGKLSGRKIEDLLSNTRELEKQKEKRSPLDFALWKSADPEHLMRWPSPWGEGFPGWHVECSVMSSRYLGEEFDIHGGGMDLLFPHHECEIAQTVIGYGKESVRYWMHNNMITLNGKKMSKSLGNVINIDELFTGSHNLLEKDYSPMSVRFFMLQAHYRSTLDFSNDALKAAEKGLERLFEGMTNLDRIIPSDRPGPSVRMIEDAFFNAMSDDFNTPVAIAHLFEGIKTINTIRDGKESCTQSDLEEWKAFYKSAVHNILGIAAPEKPDGTGALSESLIRLLLQMRIDARQRKDFELADRIRDEMANLGIEVNDTKDGFEWKLTR
jgi:cysteinyl-tRNA synthetase